MLRKHDGAGLPGEGPAPPKITSSKSTRAPRRARSAALERAAVREHAAPPAPGLEHDAPERCELLGVLGALARRWRCLEPGPARDDAERLGHVARALANGQRVEPADVRRLADVARRMAALEELRGRPACPAHPEELALREADGGASCWACGRALAVADEPERRRA